MAHTSRFSLSTISTESASANTLSQCRMVFKSDYPMKPPTFKFLRPIHHPNIYPDGRVCISILHEAGHDEMSGESADERWSPLQTPDSILRSILVLLDSPEISSPANVDASVLYRTDRAAFAARAHKEAELSKKDIPEGFVMPTTFEDAPPEKPEYDHDFMYESADEDDFGGSDSDVDLSGDDEGDQEFDSEEDQERTDDNEDDLAEELTEKVKAAQR